MNKSKDQLVLESLYNQVVEEAKKKVNPWAVAKSIAKKKHLGPKKEEEIVKGVKKSAKKYGKKVTSDKIVKEEYDEDLTVGSTNFPHGYGYPNTSEKDSEYDEVVRIDFFVDDDSSELNSEDPKSYPAFVTAYDVTRAFGGHEEGGWWYDHSEPLESIEVNSFEEAQKAAKKLYDLYSEDIDGKFKIYLEKQKGSENKGRPHYE